MDNLKKMLWNIENNGITIKHLKMNFCIDMSLNKLNLQLKLKRILMLEFV